jgi:tetratricopeptide (TPR) repeat protein
LAVFHSGCSLEIIETVCNPDGQMDMLEISGCLVEKGLLRRELDVDGRLRFEMPDTLRDFAVERLSESGEMAVLQERHARCYMDLAKNIAGRGPTAGPSSQWPDFEIEIENLRAALNWSLATPGMLELGAGLANNLFWFWYQRRHLIEAQTWLQRLLLAGVDKSSPTYAAVLAGAGMAADWLGDPSAARCQLDESIPLLHPGDDCLRLAMALLNRGIIAINAGRAEDARPDLEEGLRLFRKLNDRFFGAVCLMHQAEVALAEHYPEEARRLLAETTSIARSIGDPWLLAAAINEQGEVARFQGDYSHAGGYYDESGTLFNEINARGDLARVIHNQAYVALRRGDARLAGSLFHQSMEIYHELGIQRGMTECLAGMAGVDAAQEKLMPAARLLGFAQAQIEQLGMDWLPADQLEIERARTSLQKALGVELFNIQESAGRKQKLEDVLAVYT